MIIKYRAGRENTIADALSRSPRDPPPQCGIGQGEFQVAVVRSDQDISATLEADPEQTSEERTDYAGEQYKDRQLTEIIDFLVDGCLPEDSKRAKLVASQVAGFTLVDGVLHYVDDMNDHRCRVALLQHFHKQLLEENHRGLYGGHFSGGKLYNALVKRWWWRGMYTDVLAYCKKCPECVVVAGAGRQHRPPLHPIPIQRPFQIIGLDMEFSCTEIACSSLPRYVHKNGLWFTLFLIKRQGGSQSCCARRQCGSLVSLKNCCLIKALTFSPTYCWTYVSHLGLLSSTPPPTTRSVMAW